MIAGSVPKPKLHYLGRVPEVREPLALLGRGRPYEKHSQDGSPAANRVPILTIHLLDDIVVMHFVLADQVERESWHCLSRVSTRRPRRWRGSGVDGRRLSIKMGASGVEEPAPALVP